MRLGWKRQVRKAAAGLLFQSRLITILSHFGSRRRLILAYHRVVPEDSEDLSFVQPGMYVCGATLDMHIRYLRAHYDVLPLEELISTEADNACAITFDDGWRDNYVTAFPILRAHGVPATIFLATGLVGTTVWPWPDRICFYIHKASPTAFSEVFESAWRQEVGEPSGTPARSADAFAAAEEVLRRLKHVEHRLLQRIVVRIDDRFRELHAALHGQRPWLTWEEALEMGSHGISFGSHTENHVILTNVPPAEARAEIVNSGTVLAAKVGKPTAAFCYPNGSSLSGGCPDGGRRRLSMCRDDSARPARILGRSVRTAADHGPRGHLEHPGAVRMRAGRVEWIPASVADRQHTVTVDRRSSQTPRGEVHATSPTVR